MLRCCRPNVPRRAVVFTVSIGRLLPHYKNAIDIKKIQCILSHLWTRHRPDPQHKDQHNKVARGQSCNVKLLKTQYQEQRDGQVGEKIPPVPKLKGVLLNKYMCNGHILWIHTFPVSFVLSKVPGCKGCKVPSKVPWPAPSLLLLLILGPLLP